VVEKQMEMEAGLGGGGGGGGGGVLESRPVQTNLGPRLCPCILAATRFPPSELNAGRCEEP
jgi:hypothetical protein